MRARTHQGKDHKTWDELRDAGLDVFAAAGDSGALQVVLTRSAS